MVTPARAAMSAFSAYIIVRDLLFRQAQCPEVASKGRRRSGGFFVCLRSLGLLYKESFVGPFLTKGEKIG